MRYKPLAPAFDLPRELEARRPPEARGLARDAVSLLVSDVRSGSHVVRPFAEIASALRSGDLLVVNDSATIPAAFDVRRANGSTLTLHLATRISERMWIVEPRRTPLIEVGEHLRAPDDAAIMLLAPVHRANARLWYAQLDLPERSMDYLARWARPIRYDYVDGAYPIETYQTIFAREPGSVEMPSAARPFTLRVIDSLYRHNVSIAPITLHCGVASPEAHEPPLDERFAVPEWTARAIAHTREAGGRIIAAGTTVVRALESAAGKDGSVRSASGWTSHIVDVAHPPRVADGLLTGFHEPRASHLLMLEAFANGSFISEAYDAAIARGLLWHEFGDVHLILP